MANMIEYLKETGQFADLSVDQVFQEIVDCYQGTCNSISCEDRDFMDKHDLWEDYDQIQFECTCCGWNYDAGEEGESPDGERFCEDCCDNE